MTDTWGNDALTTPSVGNPAKEDWGTDKLQGAPDPKMSPAEHFAEAIKGNPVTSSLFQGATLGFGDEIDAGLSALATGFGNLTREAVGLKPKFSMGEAYDATLASQRGQLQQFGEKHPIAETGLELAGGFLTPGVGTAAKFIRGGETVASRIGRSALTGAGIGGLAGFASGENSALDRMSHAIWGMPFGALTGAGLAGAGEASGAAKKLAGTLGGFFKQAFRTVSGKTPEQAMKDFTPAEVKKYQDMAVDYVRQLMEKSGKKPEQLTQDPAHQMGKPVTGAEAIGRPAINQLASLARRAGTTPDSTESLLRQRTEATPQRVQSDLAAASGVDPSSVHGDFEKLTTSLRAKAAPLYQKAYAEPAPNSENNEVIKGLMQRPSMKSAINRAREIAAEEGRNPDTIASATKHDRVLLGNDPQGKPQYVMVPKEFEVKNPTMQTWDYVKRGLQQVLNREHRDITGKLILDDQSRPIMRTIDELRTELFKNDAYREAVAAGGEPLQLEEAYKEAPKMMGSGVSEDAFSKRLSKFTPAQVEAFKGGWVNNVFEQVRSGKLKLKDMRSPSFQTKARTLLGWSKADDFIKRVEQEQRLVAGADRMMPGRQSITGELIEAGKEHDEGARDIHTAVDRAIRRGPRKAVEEYVGDKVYRLFEASRTPGNEQIRNEVGKLLQMRPSDLRALLESTGTPSGGPKTPSDLLSTLGSMSVPTAPQVAGQNQ